MSNDDKHPVLTWDLQNVSSKALRQRKKSVSVDGGEAVIDGDGRQPVAFHDFQPGGRFHGIGRMSVTVRDEKGRKLDGKRATACLIGPDLIMTAAHCVFFELSEGRRSRPLIGRRREATHVKVYFGYNGRESVEDAQSGLEVRYGVKVAVSQYYITSKGGRRVYDVALIKLNKSLSIRPFPLKATPLLADNVADNETIGVVGFPSDKTDNGEKGSRMYEQFSDCEKGSVTWPTKGHQILSYTIATFKGQSGSPVLCVKTSEQGEELEVIGVHHGYVKSVPVSVAASIAVPVNVAASIAGVVGNPIHSYEDAIRNDHEATSIDHAVSLVQVEYHAVSTASPEQLSATKRLETHGKIKEVLDELGALNLTMSQRQHQGPNTETDAYLNQLLGTLEALKKELKKHNIDGAENGTTKGKHRALLRVTPVAPQHSNPPNAERVQGRRPNALPRQPPNSSGDDTGGGIPTTDRVPNRRARIGRRLPKAG